MGKTIGVWLDDADEEALRKIAEKENRSISNVLNIAIKEFLKRRGKNDKSTTER